MNIAMLWDNVLLQLDPEKKMEGLIHIPETATDKPQTATVVAVGPGVESRVTDKLIELPVVPGDRVVFLKYAGATVELDGNSYIVIKVRDLIAVVRSPQPDSPDQSTG